ncbi:bifunctional 3'-5' exonuclease/DNA polymerase [Brachybacterium muris]|uniref:bifunctional 3'-5' exonuclease/DNA polymerase n=1 Tax=Brachybacterium muris TaxID=219301 RepID=UPI0023EF41F9|nr:bifunctional 3'-5' exonuclease/DNA polymerase [Brachybacterium muris]
MTGPGERDAPVPPWCAIGRTAGGQVALVDIADDGTPGSPRILAPADLPSEITRRQHRAVQAGAAPPRWVWSDAPAWYPGLLASGVRVQRCHDLRLIHTVLRHSQLATDPRPIRAAERWHVPVLPPVGTEPSGATLFDLDGGTSTRGGVPMAIDDVLEEFERQRRAIEDARDPGRLRLLVAAESAGALIAVELQNAGIPWDVAEHDRILTADLGPRPRPGHAPTLMVEVAAQVREALGDPLLSIDSPPKLLRALHRAGIDVRSTSRWELAVHEHPAIEPLLRYKKMSRLLTANGWAWMDEWVREGRYRPVYVPGGVVTGRWASSGGGALQIPRQLRPALRADPGWRLVSADVSQLEPRVLAAMAGDRAMARAGAGTDLYAGIVAAGVVTTRQEAKVGVLGALYGGTTGDSGRIVPRLRRTFPDAMGLVDQAAETGERGGTVSTLLGRSSPPPEQSWADAQLHSNRPEATPAEQERARRSARDRGRFTRNFVVQGTAAEWALSWMAALRLALAGFDEVPVEDAAHASGPTFSRRAHLAFFLHDEVIVHAPASQAEAAAQAVRDAADAAGRLLFPGSPVDFPLDLEITERSPAK